MPGSSGYPGSIDNFTDPNSSSGDTLDSATVPHDVQHGQLNRAVNAIESTLGVNPQGGYATVAARLAAVGGVQLVVARAGVSTNLASTSWVTYPLDGTPSVNLGGGSYNTSTFIYTVPENGLYLCLGSIRIADASTARSVGIGIGTANADGPHVLWGNMGLGGASGRDGRQYTRLTRFNANDQVRLFIYSDGSTFPTQYDGTTSTADGQYMALFKLAD